MTEGIFQITKETKSLNVTKSAQKWPRKHPTQAVLNKGEKKAI